MTHHFLIENYTGVNQETKGVMQTKEAYLQSVGMFVYLFTQHFLKVCLHSALFEHFYQYLFV